jgi:hypothetical protein
MSTWDNEPDEDRAAESVGEAHADLADLPLEAPEADAIEQSTAADPALDDDGPLPQRLDVPLEAAEADVIDQALSVAPDDDE